MGENPKIATEVAGVAGGDALADEKHHGFAFTVHRYALDELKVSGGFSLTHELLLGASEQINGFCIQAFAQSVAVEVTQRQYLFALGILDDRGDQAVIGELQNRNELAKTG